MVITERWTCLYTGRTPMIDEEAETLPVPSPGWWNESEEIAYHFSRFVSKLRLLPAQLTALTTRKPGDWSTQRTRDQKPSNASSTSTEASAPSTTRRTPQPRWARRSQPSILADCPRSSERIQHLDTSDTHIQPASTANLPMRSS